jgi:hypothetical protein
MIRSWLAAALLAAATAAGAAETPQGVEEGHFGWLPVKVDPAGGVAYFLSWTDRAGSAVQFHMLAVYRDVQRHRDIGSYGREFDKEIFGFLGDCGSRMLLRTGYSYQKATEPVPILLSPVQIASVPLKDSGEDLALAAACRGDQSRIDFNRTPYVWAKQRLSQPRP